MEFFRLHLRFCANKFKRLFALFIVCYEECCRKDSAAIKRFYFVSGDRIEHGNRLNVRTEEFNAEHMFFSGWEYVYHISFCAVSPPLQINIVALVLQVD